MSRPSEAGAAPEPQIPPPVPCGVLLKAAVCEKTLPLGFTADLGPGLHAPRRDVDGEQVVVDRGLISRGLDLPAAFDVQSVLSCSDILDNRAFILSVAFRCLDFLNARSSVYASVVGGLDYRCDVQRIRA